MGISARFRCDYFVQLSSCSRHRPKVRTKSSRIFPVRLWLKTSTTAFEVNCTLVQERIPLDPFFVEAEGRRNEGLMLKAANSTYAPGKRGMSWLKWKKALATLDVVVTGVEFGHGRRRDVLSDYTFAIQQDGELLNIGKAYSGLTDVEIEEMTGFFKQHTTQDFGRFRLS